MIHLTFKNVGQGDSILLEWEHKGVIQLCVIDCNLYQGKNPVLDYIIEKGYSTIDYIILSHPHLDHFSGFLQLLEYCKANSIRINYFLHTCSQVPSYLQACTKSAHTERELQRLFLFLTQNQSNQFKVGYIHGDLPNSSIPLTNDLSLKFLSPTTTELNNYVRNSYYPFTEEESLDNPKANWLSTILKLESNNWYVLLTSDSDKASLIRIDKHNSNELDKILLIGQIPHHGAFGNHNNTFWRKRNRSVNTSMVVSTGPNSFGHPSEKVIDFFLNHNFVIYSTSQPVLTGFEYSLGYTKEVVENLDVFSYTEFPDNLNFNGDHRFSLDPNILDFEHLSSS